MTGRHRLASPLQLFVNCGDEDCVAPPFAENIVGTWEVGDGTATFNADGTIDDPDHNLMDVSVQGIQLTVKSYMISGDTLTVRGENPDNTVASWDEYILVSNNCDVIETIFQEFIPVVFNRK